MVRPKNQTQNHQGFPTADCAPNTILCSFLLFLPPYLSPSPIQSDTVCALALLSNSEQRNWDL